jgi:hypothetical protein
MLTRRCQETHQQLVRRALATETHRVGQREGSSHVKQNSDIGGGGHQAPGGAHLARDHHGDLGGGDGDPLRSGLGNEAGRRGGSGVGPGTRRVSRRR